MSPPDDMEWKGDDGKKMFMRRYKIACGVKVLTLKDFGDTTEGFPELKVGQVIRVDIDNTKSEKGNIEISGSVTVLL